MKDLSITQEYMLCAMNEKGKISGFDTNKLVCMVAAGLLELQMADCIQLEKKKVMVINSLPENKSYLHPLYDFIDQGRPIKVEKIIEEYNYSFSDKKLKDFMGAVGNSLADMGLVSITEMNGVIGRKKSYVPSREAVHHVIDMIRAEILEDGKITEDIVCLVVLLERSRIIKTYFSAFEQKEIRQKLKEIVNSEAGKLVKYMIDYIDSIIAMMTALTVMYIN